ncbi:hypothetical protein [Burkholderia sp. RF2-non_BP3]|uniref:hypothetical protein n=1 Tax=Burkholderia sp. RF2-non_BP3 TaxID=1637844 RepID=UPI0009E9FFE7|nr:hypothetical protein [Burkholderia sp. RF2-non_BP3]
MAEIKEIWIKCPNGHRFRSPIFLGDTETFDSGVLFGNTAQCPTCGALVDCNKENMSYILADGSGGLVGDGFGKK